MKVYSDVCKTIEDLFQETLEKKFDILANHGIKFEMIAVENLNKEGEYNGPALKKNGTPVSSLVKLVPLQRQLRQDSQVEIFIDKPEWDDLIKVERVAVIESLLNSISIKYDKEGVAKVNDLGNVMLQIRKPDFCVFGQSEDLQNPNNPIVQKVLALHNIVTQFSK